jgi:hypothetical protein
MVKVRYGFLKEELELKNGDKVEFLYDGVISAITGRTSGITGKIVGLKGDFPKKLRLEGRFFGFKVLGISYLERLPG